MIPKKIVGIFISVLIICFPFLVSCQGFGEQILYNKADEAHRRGDFEKAIRIYKKLLKEDPEDKVVPSNALLNYDLGIAYIDMGDRKKVPRQIAILKELGRDDLARELKRVYIISDSYTYGKQRPNTSQK